MARRVSNSAGPASKISASTVSFLAYTFISMNCIRYHIDQEDRIRYIDENWDVFAFSNQSPELGRTNVINKNLFDFIQNWDCRHIYQILFKRVRDTQESIEFPFRCDSPDAKRFMRMRLAPLAQHSIELTSCILREEKRIPLTILDSQVPRSSKFLKMCSWCKKIEVDASTWLEADQAVYSLNLFASTDLPQITHGMCPDCFKTKYTS